MAGVYFAQGSLKERIYVMKSIRVNGRSCTSLPQFQILTDVLHVRIEFENAWRFWVGYHERKWGPFSLQLQVLNSLCDALDEVSSLEGYIKECRFALEQCGGMQEPIWNDESQIQRLIGSCRLALARIDTRHVTQEIQQIEEHIAFDVARQIAHPVAHETIEALQKRNVDAFARTQARIQELNENKMALEKLDEYLRKMRRITPRLTENLERSYGETCWNVRIQQIRNTWCWAQARTWLKEYIRKEDAPSLAIRARQIEDEIAPVLPRLLRCVLGPFASRG